MVSRTPEKNFLTPGVVSTTNTIYVSPIKPGEASIYGWVRAPINDFAC